MSRRFKANRHEQDRHQGHVAAEGLGQAAERDAPAGPGQVVQHDEEERTERDRQIEDEGHQVGVIEQRRGMLRRRKPQKKARPARSPPGPGPARSSAAPPVPTGASRFGAEGGLCCLHGMSVAS